MGVEKIMEVASDAVANSCSIELLVANSWIEVVASSTVLAELSGISETDEEGSTDVDMSGICSVVVGLGTLLLAIASNIAVVMVASVVII